MTDFRALCAGLADALDNSHQRLTGDPSFTHPLADRARAALAEGEKGPSYEDLIRLATASGIEEWWAEEDGNGWTEYSGKAVSVLAFARAVLARWGSTPPHPVPVSERLPTAEDCDAEGRCWVHQPREFAPEQPAWELMRAKYAASNYGATHWLAAHALPLPENADD